MSFDIFFQTCRFGTEPVEVKNPFTGEVQSTLPQAPLTDAELQAVQAVLAASRARGPDDFGCYVVDLDDGGSAEAFADKLAESCMVSVRAMTPGLVQFLFDVLKAGNWAMLPAIENNLTISCSATSVTGLPDGFPPVVVCDSAAELGLLLTKGYDAWSTYRDKVMSYGREA